MQKYSLGLVSMERPLDLAIMVHLGIMRLVLLSNNSMGSHTEAIPSWQLETMGGSKDLLTMVYLGLLRILQVHNSMGLPSVAVPMLQLEQMEEY